jgi:hypothetical protein
MFEIIVKVVLTLVLYPHLVKPIALFAFFFFWGGGGGWGGLASNGFKPLNS